MSANRLLASGLTYSSAFPWASTRLKLPVAWWTFVSGYSCGTATDLHRVPGPMAPCPPTCTGFPGAQQKNGRPWGPPFTYIASLPRPRGTCLPIQGVVSWLPAIPTRYAFPKASASFSSA